ALVVYFAAAGGLGLFFSVAAANVLRATLATLILIALLCFLPLVALLILSTTGSVADLAEGVVLLLDVLQWSWALGLAAAILMIVAKFASPETRANLFAVVKGIAISVPVLIIGLVVLFAVATSYGLHLSMGETCACLSPFYVVFECCGSEGWHGASESEIQA